MKKWMDKPITWKSYLKLCGVSTLISAVYTVGYLGYFYKDNIKDFVEEKRNKK